MAGIEHVAIGNRAGRRQRSQGSWHKHGAVRVINVKAAREAASECGQRASFNLLRPSSFSLTLRLASISALKFEAIYGKNQETGAAGVAAIIEGGNYESIYRSESGHRGRDGLHRVDSGRYGPRLAKADPNS